MSAYEMMLSESQERMLMVLKPEKEQRGRGDLPQVGPRFRGRRRDHADKRFVVRHDGEVMADLPIKELGDEAPVYDRPLSYRRSCRSIDARDVTPPIRPRMRCCG